MDGDFYLDVVAHTIHGPKTSGVWGSPTSLAGPQREQGPQGEQGELGPQGIPGTPGATGEQGPQGDEGPQGDTGPAGPNSVSGTTATTLTGILKGDGSLVGTVTIGTGLDYTSGTLSTTGGGGGTTTASTQDFRLTTESGAPVSTSDRTSQSTIYLTPYLGQQLALYDGSAWVVRSSAEVSLALTGLTSSKNYDVFAYWTGSAVALELSGAWTNDTTRADAIARQDGVWCKSGTPTRRLVGTIRASGATTTEDGDSKRYVWNANNRVPRRLFRRETTANWTYNSATWRPANNNANMVEVVSGLAGQVVDLALLTAAEGDSADVPTFSVGVDTTTTPSSDVQLAGYHSGNTSMHPYTMRLVATLGLGYHYATWLEKTTSTQTHQGGDKSGLWGVTHA